MGGKPTRRGNALYIFAAFLILWGPVACTLSQTAARITDVTGEEARAHLAMGQKYYHEGNFNGALLENEAVISLAGVSAPVAESLFYIGLIHGHPANPARDDEKSLTAFLKLIKDYPESPLADQAKELAGLIEENGQLRKRAAKLAGDVDRLTNNVGKLNQQLDRSTAETARLNQQLDRMTAETGRLNRLIEELKKVDIDVEQQKREKGR